MTLPALKGRFPFRLSVPSYLVPDAMAPNIRRIGPFVDEVELLFFEAANIPDESEIAELAGLASEFDLTYNVHLPLDASLAAEDEAQRVENVRAIMRAAVRAEPLGPSCRVLHLEPDRPDQPRDIWLERSRASLAELVERGLDPRTTAIENLAYPLDAIADPADELGFAFCQDIGHLLRHGHDLDAHLRRHLGHTRMIHLHGMAAGRDHRPLTALSESEWGIIRAILEDYRGGLCLEVFSLDKVRDSLPRLLELANA